LSVFSDNVLGTVYNSYVDWLKWYWGGAVHINDVVQSVMKSIELLSKVPTSTLAPKSSSSTTESVTTRILKEPLFLTVDGAYEYSDEELGESWDKEGPETTFKKHFGEYYDMVCFRCKIQKNTNQIHYYCQSLLLNINRKITKSKFYLQVKSHGIDVTKKPTKADISDAKKNIGYDPQFGLKNALAELKEFGSSGPKNPVVEFNNNNKRNSQ
jgi:hypothetical protein